MSLRTPQQCTPLLVVHYTVPAAPLSIGATRSSGPAADRSAWDSAARPTAGCSTSRPGNPITTPKPYMIRTNKHRRRTLQRACCALQRLRQRGQPRGGEQHAQAAARHALQEARHAQRHARAAPGAPLHRHTGLAGRLHTRVSEAVFMGLERTDYSMLLYLRMPPRLC